MEEPIGYNAEPYDVPSPTTEEFVPVETPSLFARVIQDHLDLKRRNADLDGDMPLDHYKSEDPFENHPLFKTEEQARLEETMDGEPAVTLESATMSWPGEESDATAPVAETETESEAGEGLWSKSRDFDWGD